MHQSSFACHVPHGSIAEGRLVQPQDASYQNTLLKVQYKIEADIADRIQTRWPRHFSSDMDIYPKREGGLQAMPT